MFQIIQLIVILFLSLSMASQSVQDLQILKQQIVTENGTLNSFQQKKTQLDQEIKVLANKRRFYQIFRTPEENNLIVERSKNLKKISELQEKLKQLNLTLRNSVSKYMTETDSGYAEIRKVVEKITPIADLGNTSVNQLSSALEQLNSSQVMSAVNATGHVIGILADTKRDALDHIAAGVTQMAVNNALKAGQSGLQSAAAFETKLQSLTSDDVSGVLSGTWSGAIGRGLIYALIVGRNPLNSHIFSISNNLFQLKNLLEVKTKVRTALEAVTPVSLQINQELVILKSKLTQAEDQLIKQL